MKKVTLDDMKIFQKVFNFIEQRGSELVDLRSFLDTKEFGDYYSSSICEVFDDQVSFECEHNRYNERSYKFFTYEQLLDDTYLNDLKSKAEKKKEQDRIDKEKADEKKVAIEREKELKLFHELKEKFGDLG